MPEHELFSLLSCTWDVDVAKALIAGRERPTVELPVRAFAPWLGLIRIDEKHAAGVDLATPVIVARTPIGVICIDGWHRIWRASQEGVETLPAVVLNESEERKARIAGTIRRPRSQK
jgi:hypothetical protein